jgi:hypothetical protein
VVQAHGALGRGATRGDAQEVALDDGPPGPGAVLVDGLAEVADDVAVGGSALPIWESAGPLFMITPMFALGSLPPSWSKPIQLPMTRLPLAFGPSMKMPQFRSDMIRPRIRLPPLVMYRPISSASMPFPSNRTPGTAFEPYVAVLTELPGWL